MGGLILYVQDFISVAFFVLCFLIALVLFIYFLIQKAKIKALTKSIDDFLTSGTTTPLNCEDNELGHLQTSICELQNRLLQERTFTQQQAKSNTEFISDISHQLKTPLAGLRLYCELENTSAPGPHTEKELALIEKMESLIQNVLTLEKIKSDTYEMNFQPCNLSGIAKEIKQELYPLFPQKNIIIQGTADLRVDASWFHEALSNVVKNACEHTAADGTITICMEPGERSVTIEVEDNGGGVEESELSKLFDRFHRTANAVPTSAGIGLAITKAIVEKHHGMISAQNGKAGLRIRLCFPVIDANIAI